jgi:hypothetical protein
MPEADFIPFLSNPPDRYPDLALGAKPEPKFPGVSVTSRDLAITAEKLSRASATSLSGLYPYTISGHVSRLVHNAFVGG